MATIRELRDDERLWAASIYRGMDFAPTPPGSVALVAERDAARIGLGRLVEHARGVIEMGGIWTDPTLRRSGIARAMVAALLAHPSLAPGGRLAPDRLWCIPFVHLAAFYQSCGFAPTARPWPAAIEAKVSACDALGQQVLVLAR